ncbi:MAG: flagellar motor stator protein MotA [Gaiellaceae bacterium]
MITLVGLVVVVASVLGGFTVAGGKVGALFHISEFLVIGGTAAGTILISTPGNVLKSLASKLAAIAKPVPFSKALYLDALKMMYELFQVARRDGLVAIESHIESPHKSSIFQKYPIVLAQHHAITFLCDSLRVVLVGSVPPHDLEALMDSEIDVHHEQETRPSSTLQRVGDALPGIGIVAAVLGIVVTMGAIAGPVEQIGEHVGAALTGTFLGVLLAYGFANPLSISLEHNTAAEGRFYYFIKASVIAFAKGLPPVMAVEFARRAIFQEDRPTFAEMESACKGLKGKPPGKA